MTLLARDEADIVDTHLAYHLDAGVDFVIATDHRSQDGTSDILRSYERAGMLHRIYEGGEFTQQGAWQTRMARLAATEYGADWVINSDADEFWWPRGRSLKVALDSVPAGYETAPALVRNFLPRRDEAGAVTERMTLRLAAPAPINDPATPFRPVVKIAHRGRPEVVVGEGGSHRVSGLPGPAFRAWYPLEVLHLPLRSAEQCARKYRKTWSGWAENLRGDLARARQAADEGPQNPIWDRVALDGSDIERGLESGSLVSDVRLRDVVRTLRGAEAAPSLGSALPSRAELDSHALDVTVFEEAELIRYQRWVDELEARVCRLGHTARARRPVPL